MDRAAGLAGLPPRPGREPAWADAAAAGAAVYSLAGGLIDSRPTDPVSLCMLHPGAEDAPQYAALTALARTIAAETPVLRCRSVQIPGQAGPPSVARLAAAEIRDTRPETEVRHHGGRRYVRRHQPLSLPRQPAALRDRGVYVLTGGAGQLAGILGDYLASRLRARLLLTGRRPPSGQLRQRMDAWAARGAQAEYVRADLAREEQVRVMLARARQLF